MHNDHQPSPRDTIASIASIAISGLALALMITAGYLTPDLLAAFGQ